MSVGGYRAFVREQGYTDDFFIERRIEESQSYSCGYV